MKVSLLPLSDLYERRITASVEKAIQEKESFDTISPTYCEKVCKLNCKTPSRVDLLGSEEVDILIIQDHRALPGKWDRREDQQETLMRSIIGYMCREAGFDNLRYRIVNVLKCALDPQDLVKGKPPTATKMLKCKPYLLSEIERTKPKVIISLSTLATKALGYTKASNTNNRGWIFDNRVVLTLHPKVLTMIRQNASGAMWGQEYYNVILRDFKKAAAMARGELVVPDRKESIARILRERIKLCKSIDDVKEVMDKLNSLPEKAVVSFDLETTSLDPHIPEAKILTIQFGYRDPDDNVIKAAVVSLWHRQNDMYDPDEAWALIAPWLESDRPKVAHHGKFDVLYLYFVKGVRVRKMIFDTMLNLHSLDSGASGTFSLKTAVWDFLPGLGIGGYEDELPGLTKKRKVKEGEESEDESEEESE